MEELPSHIFTMATHYDHPPWKSSIILQRKIGIDYWLFGVIGLSILYDSSRSFSLLVLCINISMFMKLGVKNLLTDML